MANLQYIGARYVPKFFKNPDDQSNDWKAGVDYEALTIVTYNNDSYTSKIPVPLSVGNPASNPQYWACTTKYTAALMALQTTVGQHETRIDQLEYLDIFVTPQMFGASGDGVSDDTQAFEEMLDHTNIFIPSGTYAINNLTDLVIKSGTRIILSDDAVILEKNNVNLFKVYYADNVIIAGGKLQGNGSHGYGHLILVEHSSNVTIQDCEITNAPSDGIRFTQSTQCEVSNCNCHHNCDFGIESLLGRYNKYHHNKLNDNGYNLDGTEFTYGRGIVVQREVGADISHNTVTGNAEYGIRIYSKTTDPDDSHEITIINNVLKDNGSTTKSITASIYLYNEGANYHVYNVIVADNIIEAGIDSHVLIALAGCKKVICSNNMLIQNASAALSAIDLYGGEESEISNNMAIDVSTYISSSAGNNGGTGFKIDGNKGTCEKFMPSVKVECIISNNDVKHSGSGASDNGIVADSADCQIIANKLDGFYRSIQISSLTDLVIKDNATRNSTGAGLYKYGTTLDGLALSGNDFDNTYPSILATTEKIQTAATCRKIIRNNGTPAENLDFIQGDIVFMTTPSPGYSFGWICTTGGTGTAAIWKSMGTIAS